LLSFSLSKPLERKETAAEETAYSFEDFFSHFTISSLNCGLMTQLR
jgi:hypothetical protein